MKMLSYWMNSDRGSMTVFSSEGFMDFKSSTQSTPALGTPYIVKTKPKRY